VAKVAKVTLRVAHAKGCANATKTALDSLDGCTCKPSFYTFHRDRSGRVVKGARVRDRRVADRAVTALQADLDAGRAGVRDQRNTDFGTWADTWLAQSRAKENTLRLYRHSVSVGKRAFTGLTLREIHASDITTFLDLLREDGEERNRPPNETTLAKHLRNLHSCFAAAVPEYVAFNPVDLLHRSVRPRVESDRWDYFTNEELERLWQSFEKRNDTFGLYLSKAAVVTGLRLGELIALERRDVNLPGRLLNVSKTFTPRIGVTTPKSRKGRTLNLSEDAARVLRDWFELRSADLFQPDALIFPGSAGNHFEQSNGTKRHLYPAMQNAQPLDGNRLKKGEWGIARLGERGNPRSFHSFRHTYARLVLEAGGDRFWLQQQLGHSTAAMTERYSMWSKTAEQAQAASFASGAFRV
jgi:integrase